MEELSQGIQPTCQETQNNVTMQNTSVQRLLGELIDLGKDLLTADEIAEVDRFARFGEYGLALETAIDICAEEGKSPSDAFVLKMVELALKMKLTLEDLIPNSDPTSRFHRELIAKYQIEFGKSESPEKSKF